MFHWIVLFSLFSAILYNILPPLTAVMKSLLVLFILLLHFVLVFFEHFPFAVLIMALNTGFGHKWWVTLASLSSYVTPSPLDLDFVYRLVIFDINVDRLLGSRFMINITGSFFPCEYFLFYIEFQYQLLSLCSTWNIHANKMFIDWLIDLK